MGFLAGLVLGIMVGIAAVFAFSWLQERRARSREHLALFIAGLSRLTFDDVRKMTANKCFPPGVVLKRQQKVEWLNQELKRVWPYVNEAASKMLQSVLEPIFEQYCPATFKSLTFRKLTLGTIAPECVGVQMLDQRQGEIVMELEIQWDGNQNISIAAQPLIGVPVILEVKDIRFSGIFRLILKPLVEELPGFGAVVFCLSQPPILDFSLKAAGGNLSSIPGLSGIIEEAIKTSVCDSLVWPERHIISILPGDYSDLGLQIVGVLKVNIVQARGLVNKDVVGKSDPFAFLYIRPILGRIRKTKTISNNLNPIWNEHFNLEVEDTDSQNLYIKVCDEEGIQNHEIIGITQIELKSLEAGKVTDLWLPLTKKLNRTYLADGGKPRGEVHVELCYEPNVRDTATGTLLPRNRTSIPLTSLENVIASDLDSAAQTRLPKKSAMESTDSIIRGVLSVTINRAENLTPMDLDKKCDPYVVLKMKKTDTENRTKIFVKHPGFKRKRKKRNMWKFVKVIEGNHNPEWNQTFDMIVENALHEMLIVEVFDHNTFRMRSIGKCALTLTRVLHDGEYDVEMPLEGVRTGKIFLHLKWTPPSPPDPQFI